MMKVQVIIPAAGSGTRLKASMPKALVILKKKPLVAYSLEVFEKSALIDGVVLVVPAAKIEAFRRVVRQYRFKKVVQVVAGGETRSQSVKNGLKAIDKDAEVVIVHDAARPFLTERMLKVSLLSMKDHKAAIIAVPVKPTIKEVNPKTGLVVRTLERNKLWEVQTPQVFRRAVLDRAHASRFSGEATDDAALVENIGIQVKVVPGEYRNIKVTTKEDLMLAEKLL